MDKKLTDNKNTNAASTLSAIFQVKLD